MRGREGEEQRAEAGRTSIFSVALDVRAQQLMKSARELAVSGSRLIFRHAQLIYLARIQNHHPLSLSLPRLLRQQIGVIPLRSNVVSSSRRPPLPHLPTLHPLCRPAHSFSPCSCHALSASSHPRRPTALHPHHPLLSPQPLPRIATGQTSSVTRYGSMTLNGVVSSTRERMGTGCLGVMTRLI